MLTKKEYQLLQSHVLADIDYGAGGSFGDGETYNSEEAVKVAKILARIAQDFVK